MKKIFITAIYTAITIFAFAQQLPVQTQYTENLYGINPAVAGTLPYNPLALSFKQLWTGIDDAPVFYSLSSNFAMTEKVGLGVKAYNYIAGPISRSGFEGSYAYHLKLTESDNPTFISMGLSAFMYQYKLDKSTLNLENPDDNAVIYSSEKLIIPDAAFGALAYNKNFRAGFSIYQLFNRRVSLLNKDYLDQRQVRHYYLHGGYDYKINENYQLDGSLMLKFIESGEFQIDVTAKCIVMKTAWAGLSFRTGDALSVLIGVSKERFALGYAYDFSISNIRKYNRGSHELMLIYNLPEKGWQRRSYLEETSTASY